MAPREYPSADKPVDARQRYIQPLRTFFWVALITVLIWVYADMEFTETDELRATLRLNTEAAADLVLLPPREYSVEFVVRGNRHSIDRLKLGLQRNNFIVPYDVSKHASQPQFALSPAELLTEALDLTKEGLTVASTAPQVINVETDALITIPDVPIEFSYSGGRARNVSAKPATTDVRVARAKWQQTLDDLEARGEEPVLRTRQVDLRKVGTGPVTVNVLGEIDGTEVRPEADTVLVSFDVVELKDTYTFDVAVQVLSPPQWSQDGTWDTYVLEWKETADWTRTVTATGPQGDLEKLRDQPQKVQAYLVLTEQDKNPLSSWDQREVTFRFPPELDVELLGDPPTVWFRLSRREAPTAETNP
jgi:hypothetical protein